MTEGRGGEETGRREQESKGTRERATGRWRGKIKGGMNEGARQGSNKIGEEQREKNEGRSRGGKKIRGGARVGRSEGVDDKILL